jgi:hypothetical protein
MAELTRRCPSRRPRAALATLLTLGPLCLLVGCGASHKPAPSGQQVQGNGFVFQAPLSWAVTKTASEALASSGSDTVGVLRFRLEHPYHPALFAAVTRELNADARRLAAQGAGRVVVGSTIELIGRKSRAYNLAYGRVKLRKIAFVLVGDTEYELLCQRLRGESTSPCRQLFGSFALLSG